MIKITINGLKVLAEEGDGFHVHINEYGEIDVDTPRGCARYTWGYRPKNNYKYTGERTGEEWK